jgi:hypothetical protein
LTVTAIDLFLGETMKTLSALLLLWPWPLLANVINPDFCFPKNNLHLDDNLNSLTSHIDEVTFNAIIDRAVSLYSPIVAAHGATLDVSRNWTDATVNA